MATCKDCLHYEMCVIVEHSEATDEDYFTEFGCDDFKDRTNWVEQKYGQWDECDWVEYDGHSECIRYPKEALRCSNCCNAFKKKLLWKRNYCPNCGAKMDE